MKKNNLLNTSLIATFAFIFASHSEALPMRETLGTRGSSSNDLPGILDDIENTESINFLFENDGAEIKKGLVIFIQELRADNFIEFDGRDWMLQHGDELIANICRTHWEQSDAKNSMNVNSDDSPIKEEAESWRSIQESITNKEQGRYAKFYEVKAQAILSFLVKQHYPGNKQRVFSLMSEVFQPN